jgi:RimJ/RimL family protein N-acetyltransferase
MLHGELVSLRARLEADGPVLHADLQDDVETRSRADSRPWRPLPPGPGSPYTLGKPADDIAIFSIVERATGELAGEALLWGIDNHNRLGHLGVSLRPAFRGRKLGADVVRVLCYYGFTVRGLHRLQLETLADNAAMRRAAEHAGFEHEGTLREAAWVLGEFADEVVYGLLVNEWVGRSTNATVRGR